jgi:hypothetical protein
MAIGVHQLLNEHITDCLGPRTRLFFDGHDGQFADGEWAAKKLDGLELLDQTCTDDNICWTLTFKYRGYVVMIDTNLHGTASLYFVYDPDCPDEILLDVVRHFDRHRHRPDWALITFVALAIAGTVIFIALLTAKGRLAGNVSLETDAADNWKPSKKRCIERIDGIVALNGASLASAGANLSVYEREQRGVY